MKSKSLFRTPRYMKSEINQRQPFLMLVKNYLYHVRGFVCFNKNRSWFWICYRIEHNLLTCNTHLQNKFQFSTQHIIYVCSDQVLYLQNTKKTKNRMYFNFLSKNLKETTKKALTTTTTTTIVLHQNI